MTTDSSLLQFPRFKGKPCRPLAAIWLSKPLIIEKIINDRPEKMWKYRIEEGDYLLIENGELKNCVKGPSHMITGCHGTEDNEFEISVIDLKTRELSIVKL